MSSKLVVRFQGPFSWCDGDRCIFTSPLGKRRGVYLWTVEYYRGGDLVYYVGETGRQFSKRMLEHFQEHMSGGYHLYEPGEFRRGNKVMLWPGRYDPAWRTTAGEFLERFRVLAGAVEELARMYRFWLAPLEVERRLRERIEAAIAEHLYAQPGVVGGFQDEGIRYRGRREGEEPIEIVFEAEGEILGLPEVLWV